MNRNNEAHFNKAPTTDIQRSKFPFSQNIKTTFNLGELIPFYVDMDIQPGDTWKINCSYVIRLSTPIKPFMDNIYIDTYFFSIPWRLVWEHTKEFYGENRNGAWSQLTEYVIPKLTTPAGGALKGSIMDYMGIPIGVAGIDFAALPIRAYTLTVNEHFRDQNLIAPYTEYKDDTDRVASNTTMELGGLPFKAARFHDALSSMLPEPQKSVGGLVGPITIPIGTTAPVITGDYPGTTAQTSGKPLYWYKADGTDIGGTVGQAYGITIQQQAAGKVDTGNMTSNTSSGNSIVPGNLVADLSNAVAATVNAQRYAFAVQRILEQFSRGGSRYTEYIKSFYKTSGPLDQVVQRPEYLGGGRQPLNVNETVQQSATDSVSPQGNLAAYSHTINSDRIVTKSFTEHCIVLGLIVARQDHSYQQGLEKQWTRRRLLDCYNPKLCHIGEQPILNKTWFAQGPAAINPVTGVAYDEEVAGYQEAWWEMRMKLNRVSGAFRSTYATSLDFWHLGDMYNSMPVLNQSWLEETPDYLDRVLAVSHNVEDQFLADILVHGVATRPLPMYSIPGLIDHF